MTTARAKAYVEMWRNRCYSDDIPERLPDLLEATARAPSWHKIAMCLLKNDMKLRGLGFTEQSYDRLSVKQIEAMGRLSDQTEFNF